MSTEKTMEGADQGLEAEQTSMPQSRHAQLSSPQNVHTSNSSSSDHDPSSPIADDEKLNDALKPTPSQAEGMSTYRIFIIMLSLCMALFLAALDVTIITTALPTIAGVFKASSASYTWIGSAYLLANAASVPLWGKLSDIWGRKPIILVANIVFMVGSLVAALSQSVGMLIGGRTIQGIGGGGLIILVNICISDLFSMRERAKYFGIVGMTWAIASAVGPVLGGIFTEKVSWRWCL
jgi:predicted MFS family arabinose efflux permease